MQPSFLQNGSHKLAYLQQEGASPTVMFCTGFKSDMTGSKASALAAHCGAKGQAFLRFDYSGHGRSSGAFTDGTISQWKSDTLAVLDRLTQGEIILIGSSMGAWLGMLATLERPERIRAFIGIASAPDFTERLIWDKLSKDQQYELVKNGVYYAPSCYGEEPYPITASLIGDGRKHLLLDSPTIPIKCPVALLHGTNDEDVPLKVAYDIRTRIPHAELHVIEGGDHRLSSPSDLELLCKVTDTIDK